MLKKSHRGMLRLVLVTSVALLVTEVKGLTVFGSVSENALKVVSENDTKDVTELLIVSDGDGNMLSVEENSKSIPALGHPGYRSLVAQQQAAHPDYITITIPETDTWRFEQSFARGELFNEFNKACMDKSNWWYYTNDKGKPLTTQAVSVTREYVWDYNLEEAAMQRAIEQAYLYGHLRPNMVTSMEVYQDLNSPYWYGRNTNELTGCYGTSAESIVSEYMEKRFEYYAGQEHRVAILTDYYYRIGIGCVVTKDGTYYTAVLLAEDKDEDGRLISLADYTEPVDGCKEMTIEVAAGDNIQWFSYLEQHYSKEDIVLEVGESFDVRDSYFCTNTGGIATVKGSSPYLENWSSKDESVATVEDGVITAVGEGDVAIVVTGKYMNATMGIKVVAPPTPEPEPTPSVPSTPSGGESGSTEVPATPPAVEQPTTPTTPQTPQAPQVPQTPQTPTLKEQKITVAKKFQKTFTVKKSSLKKKSKSYKLGVKVNDGGMHGVVTYKVTKYPKKGKKYISVSSKGKVTLKKGAKKGTYKIRITAAKAGGYKQTSKTVTIKVK